MIFAFFSRRPFSILIPPDTAAHAFSSVVFYISQLTQRYPLSTAKLGGHSLLWLSGGANEGLLDVLSDDQIAP